MERYIWSDTANNLHLVHILFPISHMLYLLNYEDEHDKALNSLEGQIIGNL